MKIALEGMNLGDPRIDSIVERARRLASDEPDICRLLVGAVVAAALDLDDVRALTVLREAGQTLFDAAAIAEQAIGRKGNDS